MRNRAFPLRAVLLTLALAIFNVFFSPRPALADDQLTGQWELERAGTDQVQLTLRYRSGHDSFGFHSSTESFDTAISKLKGLDLTALASSGTKSQFDVVRDAGTFQCVGWFANSNASGHWTFAPSTQFAAALRDRGLGAPDEWQQLRLALADVTLRYVDLLKSAGYTLTVDNIIKAANHGVDERYVKAMSDLGYKPSTLEGLIKMRDHGVDPDYIRSLMASGLGSLPVEEIVKMRDHGVDADYAKAMRGAGLATSAESLIRMRDHGVDTEYVRSIQQTGFQADDQELIRLRDHGITAEYVRQFGKGRSAQELIRMHDQGIRASM